MDFSIPDHVQNIVHRVRQFIDDEVIPVETELRKSGQDASVDDIQALREKANPMLI